MHYPLLHLLMHSYPGNYDGCSSAIHMLGLVITVYYSGRGSEGLSGCSPMTILPTGSASVGNTVLSPSVRSPAALNADDATPTSKYTCSHSSKCQPSGHSCILRQECTWFATSLQSGRISAISAEP